MVATAVVLLAACQPLPHPFADDVPRPGSPMLTLLDSASVTIAPIDGTPQATAEKLGPAMASALQQREIAASDKTASIGSYELVGRIEEMPPSGDKAALVAVWELRDPSGRSLGERTERLEAPAHDWEQGAEDAVALLAAASADRLVALLQDDAPTEADSGGHTRLLISGVEGAPGDGRESLPRAITEILKRQDLAIVTDPEAKADLVLDADVVVANPKAGKQNVKIVWRVRRKDGAEIGTVGQENDVPAGLLDGAWGDVAYMVAVSAQDGIMQLVARGAPTVDREVLSRDVANAMTRGYIGWCVKPSGCARRRERLSAANENPRLQQQSATCRGDVELSRLAAHQGERAPLFGHGGVRRDPRERARRGRFCDPVDVVPGE